MKNTGSCKVERNISVSKTINPNTYRCEKKRSPEIMIKPAIDKSSSGVTNKAFVKPIREIILLLNKSFIPTASNLPIAKKTAIKVAISAS